MRTGQANGRMAWASAALAWLGYLAGALALLALAEQLQYSYRRWRYGLDGPLFVTPFVGSIVEMVSSPYEYWERMRRINPRGLVANNLIGSLWSTFAVFVTDATAAREVLMKNSPDDFSMVLHPSGVRVRTAAG